MRILHVLSTLNPEYGGPVESVKQLGMHVARFGVTVEAAVCGDRPDDPWIASYPLKVHALGPAAGARYRYTPRLRPWLRRNGRDYDAWVINGLWQFNSFGAAGVAQKLQIPYFVYTHGMLDPWSRRAHPVKYLKKRIYWSLVERNVLRNAQAVCFTAEEEAQLAATYFSDARWNGYVVGAGVAAPTQPTDAALAALLAEFPQLVGKRVWIFLGRLHSKKGIDLLLAAFREVAADTPALHLAVAGPGDADYTAAMQALAAKLGIADRVTFTGALYGPSKWAALRASELFVLPSHQENFGVAVAEALAMGVPVCISDKVNIWREIKSAGAGLVCTDDTPGLAAALRAWEALGPAGRDSHAKRALPCFEEHFHVERPARRYVSLISSAVAGRERPGPSASPSADAGGGSA